MNVKTFLEKVHSQLKNKPVMKAFNSTGSHIFFYFDERENPLSIWVGVTSWRMTKNGDYLVGSEDSSKKIDIALNEMVGLAFQNCRITSQFLDIEFSFQNGYTLSTFFNWVFEDQWVVFLYSDEGKRVTFIGECEDQEGIKKAIAKTKLIQMPDEFQKIDLDLNQRRLESISRDEDLLPRLYFENSIEIVFEACTYRLEKDGEYLAGYLDEIETDLDCLIGKRLLSIEVASEMMDARFTFEDGYVLKTFSCVRYPLQWQILDSDKDLFSARIPLHEDGVDS